jgi:hypothetical protein
MPTPTYSQLITLSSRDNGLIPESIEERILTILAMLASGQAPDGTATPAVSQSNTLPPATISTIFASMGPTQPGGAANQALYLRNLGGAATISSIWLKVGASSGNVCVGVYAGGQGRTPPGTRLATSGSIPCPASGEANIPLGASAAVDTTCYFAIVTDNTAATFTSFQAGVGGFGLTGFAAGFAYYQSTAFPLPATAAPSGGAGSAGIVMQGA